MKHDMMDWKECKESHIKEVELDADKIKSLIKMSEIELKIVDAIPLDDNSASKLAKDYYEIIKELLIALLLSHGLKSDNHECLVSFFKEKYPDMEYEANTIYDLKVVRNKVSYNGFFVRKDYVERNKAEFKHIILFLIKLIRENVQKTGQVD